MRAALLASVLVLTAACGAGAQPNSGGGTGSTAAARTSRNFQVGAFERISLTGAANVVVAVGGQPSVTAEGDAALIEGLDIDVVNGELRIGMKPGTWSGSHGGLNVRVTVPGLQAAALSGAGDMHIDHVQGQAFAATVGGAGDLDIGELRVGRASFNLSGQGRLQAAGGAQQVDAALGGAGTLSLAGFEARDASVSLSGTGHVAMRATGTAQVQLSGVGDVEITGSARCTVARSGLGRVRCGNADAS
jgi:hypothetical protein